MIFLTLGTHQPFDRLVRAVDRWCAEAGAGEVVGQITDPGSSGYRPAHFRWTVHLAPDAYRQHFEAAEFVVAHAGMGSIITALSLAKPILVMPRRAALGEQRNDHQLATVSRLRGREGVEVAMDEAELIVAMDRMRAGTAGATRRIAPFAEARLTDALRSVILARRSAGRA